MSTPLPPLDLSGQDDHGDQTALTRDALPQITEAQPADPDPTRPVGATTPEETL